MLRPAKTGAALTGRPSPCYAAQVNDAEHDAQVRFRVLEEIIIEAARSGGITREVVDRVADRLEDDATGIARGHSRDIATWAMHIAMSVHGQTRQEYEAEFRRKQIRERTALIERAARRDGGNDPE